jgi:hypothetical protein
VAAETLVLDPVEVATGRSQLDISAYVKAEGVDWGDGAIETFMADRERGSAPVDFRTPNRQIVLPLNIKPIAGVSFVAARRNIQAKVARIQIEGGWFKRTTAAGTLFLDVVNATLHFGGDWMQATRGVDTNAELHLEAIPDWYGPEVTLPDRVDTTNGDLIWTESNIPGDYPGRIRLVVDDDQGVSQLGLLWGVRCRHYSNSTTAALRYFASQLTPLDAASFTGGAIIHPSISTSWTPMASTDLAGVSMTHTGTYRVWARVSVASQATANLPRFRLVWDVGDFALPTENRPAQLPIGNQTMPLDLGEVRLDRVPAGTHRWRGVIQAAGFAGGENVTLDRLWFQPVDEGCGVLRAPTNVDPGLNPYLGRDEFNQSAGVLTGKAAPVGGTWQGAGNTNDFVVDATNRWVQRVFNPDVDANTGRYAILSAGSASTVAAQVDVLLATPATGGTALSLYQGVVARYSDTNNWLMATLLSTGTDQGSTVTVRKRQAGTVSTLASVAVARPLGSWYTIRLWASSTGTWSVWAGLQGGVLTLLATGTDTALATGGALASGRSGFYDAWVSSGQAGGSSIIRRYDNFGSWVPTSDAVLFASQSAELRTEGMFREDATGVAFGPVSKVVGDLPRIPPSGVEGRPVQFFLKASRGDFDTLPDTGVDDISARISYRPSFLLTS